MTKFLTKAAVAATVAGTMFASPALAAPAGTGQFDAKAKIVKAVTLTKGVDLDFGTTVMNASLVSAKVTVGDAATSVAVCSSAQLSCQGGFPATFTVTGGSANQSLAISFDTPPTKLDHISLPGASVAFSLNNPVETVVLDNAGAGDFRVGGEITVVAATKDGEYKATVNVNANYL
jgi:hypothetical protein